MTAPHETNTIAMRLVVPALIAAACLAPSAAARPFTPEDLINLRRLSSIAVSPDGSRAAFVVRETDLAANRSRADIWTLDLTDPRAAPEPFNPSQEHDETAPAFSEDGSLLYYLSSRAGSQQVWLAPLDGGRQRQVTQIAADLGGFTLAPGGDRIAVWFDEAASCATPTCPNPPAERNAGNGDAYDAIFARHWDRWEDGTQSRLAVYDLTNGVASGEGRVVSAGLGGNAPSRPFGGGEEIAWAADGGTIYFALREAGSAEPTSTDLDIYAASLDRRRPRAPRNLTEDNRATDTMPAVSPDGRTLAYAAMARPGYESDRYVIWLRDVSGGAPRALTAGWDRSAGALAWSADGRHLLVEAQDTLEAPLFRIDISTGAIERMTGEGSVSEIAPLPDGGALVVMSTALSPPDIFRVAPDRAISQLTRVNADRLAGIDIPTMERFSFAGAGGDTVHGLVFRPPGLAEGARAPVVLWIHGGPQGSFGNAWSWRWNYAAQAAHGYGLVTVDFHGSTGHGQAFTDEITGDWGGAPLEDLRLGLAAALATNPWLDGDRACALGASYGGYMINWIAGQWADRFDCLVNHDGIFDTRSFYYETEELWFPEHDFGGPEFAVPENYERWNPIRHVANWRTPMLVIHGDRDFRIPVTQGLATFTALQRRGIASRLLVFPDENHWVLSPRNSLQWHREVYGWLDRWIGAGTNAAPTD